MKQARLLYETFMHSASAPMHIVPWDELPPITQNAWVEVWERAKFLIENGD
jgi:hypothetical protein